MEAGKQIRTFRHAEKKQHDRENNYSVGRHNNRSCKRLQRDVRLHLLLLIFQLKFSTKRTRVI